MKILAIESSSLVASAAIINDDILVAEYTVNHKKKVIKVLQMFFCFINKNL